MITKEPKMASTTSYKCQCRCRGELNAALAKLAKVTAKRDKLAEAVQKVSDIRDSIVGSQSFNWSEHAYPLVAVLDAAGFAGAGYAIARKNLGTLIDQRDAATARAVKAEAGWQVALDQRDADKARATKVEAKLVERDTCWHCHVSLATEEGRPRCDACYDECDIDGCDEPGCAGGEKDDE